MNLNRSTELDSYSFAINTSTPGVFNESLMNHEQNGIALESVTIGVVNDDWPRLLNEARLGDEAALGEICKRLHRYLRTIVSTHVSDALRPKVANSDIVQQTMLDVCRDFTSLRGNTERQCRAWIRQSLRRNIIDAARKYCGTRRQSSRERAFGSHVASPVSISDSQTASRILIRKETDTELLNAIGRLPLQQRRVLELRHQCGLDYAQIANRLGITEVAARKCWSRAASTLAKELAVDHE